MSHSQLSSFCSDTVCRELACSPRVVSFVSTLTFVVMIVVVISDDALLQSLRESRSIGRYHHIAASTNVTNKHYKLWGQRCGRWGRWGWGGSRTILCGLRRSRGIRRGTTQSNV